MRIDHILFPVDFSEPGLAMNAEVEWLASRFRSKVTLLHTFEVPTSWYGAADAPLVTGQELSAYADAETQRLNDYRLHLPENRIQRIASKGSAARHIAEWSAAHEVDLIVMGTHGHGPVRRLLLGSVAMKVLHDVECPVWTHRNPGMAATGPGRGIARILCSINLSSEAVPLLRFARDIAKDFAADSGAAPAASVELVHCVPGMQTLPAEYFDREFHQSLKATAHEEIARLQREAGTEFPVHITEGSLARDIAELAVKGKAELVIIGRGKAQETFGALRTHAYEIIRHAPCPVLSFSTGDHRAGILTSPVFQMAQRFKTASTSS